MKFLEKITGSDLRSEMDAYRVRVRNLPEEYQAAWKEIEACIWTRSDFSGRGLMPVFDGILGLLEESAAEGLKIREALGDGVESFCTALAGEEKLQSYQDRWRGQLNRAIERKISKKANRTRIREIIEGRKKWRAHMAHVKVLPKDYRIVYKEIRRYLFKTGPSAETGVMDLLEGIVGLFMEGISQGKSVLEVTGSDLAAFCDGLIRDR